MQSVKIGDIVEIRSTRGFSYAQYTHRHKQYGALLNVFDKTFEERPDDIAAVAELSSRFLLFFPLGAAIAKGIFKIVGNVQVPNNSTDFPIFRAGVVESQTGKVAVWWLYGGCGMVRKNGELAVWMRSNGNFRFVVFGTIRC